MFKADIDAVTSALPAASPRRGLDVSLANKWWRGGWWRTLPPAVPHASALDGIS